MIFNFAFLNKIVEIKGQFKKKNGSLLGHFVHPRGKISNLVFKWIFGCTVAKICYIKQNKSRNTQKRPNKFFCKNHHWIVWANLINLQKKWQRNCFWGVSYIINKAFEPCISVFIQVWWLVPKLHLQLCMLTHYSMKVSEQIWVNTIVALHSWGMLILYLQHTYTTYHQFVCYFLVIPIMFNYLKMLNQSYIYKLVWKMQVNCQCYTPDVLRVFTLNLSLQKI